MGWTRVGFCCFQICNLQMSRKRLPSVLDMLQQGTKLRSRFESEDLFKKRFFSWQLPWEPYLVEISL
jgi:hypothetical protein